MEEYLDEYRGFYGKAIKERDGNWFCWVDGFDISCKVRSLSAAQSGIEAAIDRYIARHGSPGGAYNVYESRDIEWDAYEREYDPMFDD